LFLCCNAVSILSTRLFNSFQPYNHKLDNISHLAYINGAEFYWHSRINGIPVTHGVIIAREIFIIIAAFVNI
jgi:hypothetical protein